MTGNIIKIEDDNQEMYLRKSDAPFDVLDLSEQVETEFMYWYEKLKVSDAPDKRKADIIDTIWYEIYKVMFKPRPEDVKLNNCKSRIKTYDVDAIEQLVEIFIILNKRYGGVIKFNQFSNLTGIHRSTLWLWNKNNNSDKYIFTLPDNAIRVEYNNIYIYNTPNGIQQYNGLDRYNWELNRGILSTSRYDVIKKLKEEMQDANTNGLSNDTMGHALRANNEEELGKLYEPRRMVQQVQIRQALTAAELPKLGQISGQFQPIEDDGQETQFSTI